MNKQSQLMPLSVNVVKENIINLYLGLLYLYEELFEWLKVLQRKNCVCRKGSQYFLVAYLKCKMLLLQMLFLYPGSLLNVFCECSTESRTEHFLGVEWIRDIKKGMYWYQQFVRAFVELGKCFIENWYYHYNSMSLSVHLTFLSQGVFLSSD